MLTPDDILGHDVIDPDGDRLGVALQLHIDEETYEVTGITVDQGFGEPSLYVGIHNVKRFGVDTVILDKRPLTNLGGREVYTEEGRYLGVVEDVKVLDDEDDALIIEDGEATKSVAKNRVVQKGDSLIVDYQENNP